MVSQPPPDIIFYADRCNYRWRKVNPKLDVPLNAMMLSMAVQVLLAFIYFGSTAAFNAFSGVGVITLTMSYAVPIVANVMGGRQQVKEGSFYLGALGTFCNWVAIRKSLHSPPTIFADQSSLVHSGHPLVLHAHLPSSYPRDYELRQCGFCRFLRHCYCLVLHLG